MSTPQTLNTTTSLRFEGSFGCEASITTYPPVTAKACRRMVAHLRAAQASIEPYTHVCLDGEEMAVPDAIARLEREATAAASTSKEACQ